MRKFLFVLLAVNFMFASVGKFVLVKGDVEIIRDGKKIKAKSGMEVENQDKINTLGIAKAQIKFEDDTIVSLGKNTNFVINDYLYAESNSKVDIGVNSGSFKVISGNVGKIARNNFKFQANTATIGIRGTIFAGEVGVKNKKDIIACVQGGIVVKIGDLSRDVNAGRMVEVAQGNIGKPVVIDSKQIETISSLDSSKSNDNFLNSNATYTYNKQDGNFAEVSQDKMDYLKKSLEYVENKKDYYVEKEYKNFSSPYVNSVTQVTNNDRIDNTLDRANGIFYYLGTYKKSSNGPEYDNAHAKVNYNISAADFTLKSDSRYSGFTYTGLRRANGGSGTEVFKGYGDESGATLKIYDNKEKAEFYHMGHSYEGELISNPTDRW